MDFGISLYLPDLWLRISSKTLGLLKVITLTIILTISIVLSLPANAYAEDSNPQFGQITVDDGLSQSGVLAILQDSQGFMWFGTQDGLNKYDGYNFTVYKYNELDASSLSDNFIESIYEDKSGAIWVGTESRGLNKFDRKTEQFTHYIHDPENPNSLGNNTVLSIYEDKFGTLWVGTAGGGLNKFNRETEQFTRYKRNPDDSNSLSSNTVLSIYEDQSGRLWIGTNDGGLNKFNRETGQFTHYIHDPANLNSLSDNTVSSIVEDRFGNLWLATSSWYGNSYGTGLNKFSPETGQFTHYTHDPANAHSLSDNIVASSLRDNSEILWIGTGFGGINKLDQKDRKFTHYNHEPANPHSLIDNHISSIYEDRQGSLWIGTFNTGLDKFDRETGQFTHYTHEPDNPNSLSTDNIWSVYEDKYGVLWIGNGGGGLNKFERETEKFTLYKHDPDNPNSLSDNTIWSIYEDKLGTLWIGTFHGGLNKFERETGKFTHYTHNPDNPKSLSDNSVFSIYEDESGTLWIGTVNGGLNKFNRQTGEFTQYKHEPDNPNSLNYDRVLSMLEYPAGTLWIGTHVGGLDKFDVASETFTHYTEKDGLPNNSVVGILGDDEGNLWLSTGKGLSKFNPETETFRNYDVSDGLQGNEFDGVKAHFRSKTGEMFFGGLNGFTAFYPEQVKDNPHIPPIVITNFNKFNENVKLDTAISETKEIKLSYKDRFFGFEFAALDYTNPQKNQYAYKLEGFDKDWIYSGTRRYASYTNLDGGRYIFRVKGSNNDGVWNEEGTSIKIIITPPPWKTWWAYTLYVVALVGAVLGYVQWRTKAQAKENALLRESERKLNQILEAIPVGVGVIDTVGKPVYFNQIALHLLDREVIPNASLDKCSEVAQLYIAGTNQLYPSEDLPLVRALRGEKTTINDVEIHQSDKIIPLEAWGTPIYDEQGAIIYGIAAFQDITERKLAEASLLASLGEKEVLLKEVHHRVKNNLQIISSLLDLQSQYIQERQVREMFYSSQNRIRSMALIHEELYKSKNFAQVNLTQYIRELTNYLLQTYALNPDNINLKLKLDEISSNLDTAIPCGLILNELISNALKHALNSRTKGTIWIELESEDNQINLVVGNDEPNSQKLLDFKSKKSLGFQLVEILVGQLEGQMEIEQSQGTVFKISFSSLSN